MSYSSATLNPSPSLPGLMGKSWLWQGGSRGHQVLRTEIQTQRVQGQSLCPYTLTLNLFKGVGGMWNTEETAN